MPGGAGPRPGEAPVELTADPRFARRIIRLAVISAVALGVIWLLARATVLPPREVEIGLAGGWLLMPSLLALSLRWPRLRYALVVPSALVSLSLLAICFQASMRASPTRAGWLLLTAGVWLGGGLGVWLWFRWLPVPSGLNQPFSRARWALIGVHVGLILGGLGWVLATQA